uniref:RNA helicase n=1 Tax=viral metagenome TaxID=1070528 RepID=A0A6C0CDZ8_9ZZZZ
MSGEKVLELSELSFDQLGINENLLRGIYGYGFEKPSIIQDKAIPILISGKDMIAQAQSGTGKTGAFSIGSLCRIDTSLKQTQLIVLSPTRELAEQTFNVMKELSTYTDTTFCKVVGGTRVSDCISDLKSDPQVIVGTPGRIIDMISKRHLFTDKLKMVVIDEADEMLSQGFQEMIHIIFQSLPRDSQVALFSATFPDELLEITDKFMNNPEKILVKKEQLTLDGIQQFYINVKQNNWKYDVLTDIYNTINIAQCIIYINSKNKLNQVYQCLLDDNFPVGMIHGNLMTNERTDIMDKFRQGEIRILLSTDLLSRGIDIQQLSLVINFDLPIQKETYIHRIGRSGRYGRKGVAINFVTERDLQDLEELKQFYNTTIEEMPQNIGDIISA